MPKAVVRCFLLKRHCNGIRHVSLTSLLARRKEISEQLLSYNSISIVNTVSFLTLYFFALMLHSAATGEAILIEIVLKRS